MMSNDRYTELFNSALRAYESNPKASLGYRTRGPEVRNLLKSQMNGRELLAKVLISGTVADGELNKTLLQVFINANNGNTLFNQVKNALDSNQVDIAYIARKVVAYAEKECNSFDEREVELFYEFLYKWLDNDCTDEQFKALIQGTMKEYNQARGLRTLISSREDEINTLMKQGFPHSKIIAIILTRGEATDDTSSTAAAASWGAWFYSTAKSAIDATKKSSEEFKSTFNNCLFKQIKLGMAKTLLAGKRVEEYSSQFMLPPWQKYTLGLEETPNQKKAIVEKALHYANLVTRRLAESAPSRTASSFSCS